MAYTDQTNRGECEEVLPRRGEGAQVDHQQDGGDGEQYSRSHRHLRENCYTDYCMWPMRYSYWTPVRNHGQHPYIPVAGQDRHSSSGTDSSRDYYARIDSIYAGKPILSINPGQAHQYSIDLVQGGIIAV